MLSALPTHTRTYEDYFLGGDESVAGNVDLSEGAGEDGSPLWWLELNVRLALERPDVAEPQRAVSLLITGLFGPL